MNDIVRRMRETAESGDIGPGASEEVFELIDYVQLLEKQLEQPQKQLDVALEQTERAWQERDATLETLRLVRLGQSINKFDVIKAETQREYADAQVLRMLEKLEESRRGEAAALERVRVLEEAPNA